jgi:pimeloyl-ACP methyl ester carboxylesterase
VQRVQFELPAGTFHALEGQGDRRVLVLHGFPDHPPTAQPFFGELVARGCHVLAPWLRGYAPSPRHGPYDLASLTGDVLALIDAWSPAAPVDVIGHDWGAVLTYLACMRAPTRIRRAVTLAVPHPRTFLHRMWDPRQLLASTYQVAFQLPGSAWLAARGNFKLVDWLWRRWSPSYALPDSERGALHAMLAVSMPAPLEYYRDARRHPSGLLAATPITTPLLALHGADDGCVLPPVRDDRHLFAGTYERETMAGLGHWLHLEAPAAVADRITRFLG